MQAFRQVVSPLGLWNCPAHRGVAKARIAGRDGFADAAAADATAGDVAALLDRFDAATECREVTCLYNARQLVDRGPGEPRGGPSRPTRAPARTRSCEWADQPVTSIEVLEDRTEARRCDEGFLRIRRLVLQQPRTPTGPPPGPTPATSCRDVTSTPSRW